jgi:hypothetical protein
VVQKHKIDPLSHGYALELSEAFCAALGDPCDKLVAEITKIALDLKKPLAESTVRSWRTYRRK